MEISEALEWNAGQFDVPDTARQPQKRAQAAGILEKPRAVPTKTGHLAAFSVKQEAATFRGRFDQQSER